MLLIVDLRKLTLKMSGSVSFIFITHNGTNATQLLYLSGRFKKEVTFTA